MSKPHKEFHQLDLTTGWATPPGFQNDQFQQRILASDIDEKNKTGSRTRLVRYEPGAFLPQVFVHDYWEEVYVLSGDQTVGSEQFHAHTYACRPPGIPHGPFGSKQGCIVLEFHYYECSRKP